MELNQISANIDYSLQSQYLQVNRTNAVDENKVSDTSGIKSDIVSLDQNISNNSNIAAQFKDDMNQLAEIQKLQNVVQTQKETVTKLELVVKNEPDLNSAQKEVNTLIDNYNSNQSRLVYSSVNELLEDRSNDDSRMYFDGILGSIPLSGQEIYEAVKQQKANLSQFEQKLDNQTAQVIEKFEKVMFEEKEVSVEVTKPLDFGKESVDFSNNSLQGMASAVVTTQPNPALQSHSLKLLA